jgi:L-asparaginase II
MIKHQISDVPLVIMSRGGITENIHRGRVSVVSASNRQVIYSCGDVNAPTFVRSTAKPVQAIASLLDGTAQAYVFELRHLALLAASHRGSPEQMKVLEEILASTGVMENDLAVGPGLPIERHHRDDYLVSGGKPRKLFHTCAGKHLGVLAWCKLKGWSIEGYIHPDHPAQQELIRELKVWAGIVGDEIIIGRDGCGFPVAAMPLWRHSLVYAQLACPASVADQKAAAAAELITRAMNNYPEYVEGRNRLASILLSDPNVVAKSGAHGVFTFGLKKEGLGISIAVTDGTEVAWPHIVKAIIEKFGGVSEETKQKLEQTFPQQFLNDVNEVAGEWLSFLA